MFSPSFAAARPSLRSVYHNLPAGARGKPPPAHGSASIRPAPGNHCPRSPGTAPSAGPPVTRPTTICRSARNIAFRPFFTCRTQHHCSGVEPPPCKHMFTPSRHTILSVRFSRAARGAAFSFFALRRPPRRTPRGFRVCRGAFACAAGIVARAVGACAAGFSRVCRDAPKKQSGARFFGLRVVVTGFTGASGKARRSPRRSCRAGYPGGRHRRTRSRRGTARLPL